MTNNLLCELRELLDEYDSLERQAVYMDEAWNSNDECARAENDPGLQYELGCKIESKIEEIRAKCQEIVESGNEG